MPVIRSAQFGNQLHPIDLATNKVLALAGRDERCDVLDTLHLDATVLPLGCLAWAAVGNDAGFSPRSLLELLRRRGRLQASDLARLHIVAPVDPATVKSSWLDALQRAGEFVRRRPPDEAGCLYYAPAPRRFVCPENGEAGEVVPHFGRPGGVLPRPLDDRQD